MSRLLFFAIIAVLIFWILRKFIRKDINVNNEPSSTESEDMLCCDYCGLHLPKSEGIIKDNQFFCSEEHYRLSSI
ncbi:MAG: preprotein translocase subunit YajC [Flavobacteriaceae bacterium]|nr:preprotein translocase subunit YajC [Flavobacteriaceae bacterium]